MSNCTSCEQHAWATHLRGGEPFTVRICSLCGNIDWDDLRRQTADREYTLADLAYQAWVVIANAGTYPGAWDTMPGEWRAAAERWRDSWHGTLEASRLARERLANPEMGADTPEPTEARPVYTVVPQDGCGATQLYMVQVNEGWRSRILCQGMYRHLADWLANTLQGKPLATGKDL
jgi:hypothetical protein